ncbi:MAG: roadblock/LC7 domain-containing protein [Candidatus Hodarchaeota archaeon]
MIDVNQVKEIIRKFEEREGIRGVIICDSTGLPIKSNLATEQTEEVSAYITALIGKSRQVVDALKEGSLKFIRLETSKGEVMVAIEEQLILIILK